MSDTRKLAFKSVPKRLPQQLALLGQILQGMQKHAKDADYPTELDSLGVGAAHDRAVDLSLQAIGDKLRARKSAGEARAETTQLLVLLEKIQTAVEHAYGQRSPALYDYGFRPLVDRVIRHRKKKGAGTAAPKTASAGTDAAGGTTTGGSAPPAHG